MLLLAELVGARRRSIIADFYNIREKSLIKQKSDFPKMKWSAPAAAKVWNQFKQIKTKDFHALYNFRDYVESRLKKVKV